ncbi:hypothetical protein JXB28_06665 [Candidatus Woesearchaeota archaeon]|nr:hypothetical protein [Candidatus Woesearchaeota archaeon]
MKKPVEIKFSDEAQKVYGELGQRALSSKADRMLFDAINKKIDLIKSNVFYGEIIPRKLIPKEYKRIYSVDILLRVELPCFWRMLYTAGDNENKIKIIAFIIEILDHEKYNKRFKYRKR